MKKLLLSFTMMFTLLGFIACDKGDDEQEPTEKDTKYKQSIYVDGDDDTTYQVTVTDYGKGTGNKTFTSDKVWILNGFVFVNKGQTLTIEPGTVIKGQSGSGANASALIVAKGGTIDAQGTAVDPIILTSAADQITVTKDGVKKDPENLPAFTRGLWGGLIVLGKAGLNSAPGETQIEGIPSTEKRGLYGGTDDADNSGTITYVSVRHGGTDIGAGNEINGITMGGVGSGTTIDYIEVVSNVDDGIECFGGTARFKHALVAFCGDDGLDYDEGYRGYIQYMLVLQETAAGNRCAEIDGGTSPEDGTPYAIPTIHNVTFIGNGTGEVEILEMRDNAGGKFYNSVFYGAGAGSDGVDIEDLGSGEDSRSRLDNGDLVYDNNIWFNIGTNDLASVAGQAFVQTHLTAGTNDIVDPAFVSFSQPVTSGSSGFDLQATATEATNTLATPADGWFTTPTFKGAFGATNWADGWSFLSTRGYLAP